MYENGNKVGIMGGEDELSEKLSTTAARPETCPDPAGEVINQTINEVPEKNSTPPDYKPNTTPPSDLNASMVPK